jgi:IS5 family transposase
VNGYKIYSLHELDICCISKGKEKNRYEFGNKVSVITSNRRSWILNVENCPANPYDGHTLDKTARDAEKITGVIVEEVSLDKGYRGHDYKGSAKIFISGGSNSSLSWSEKRRKRRRRSIEPMIGHLKSDHHLGRCFYSPC